MSPEMKDFIGLVAGALTTVAFVPQLLKIYASKSGKDVSARMFVIFSAGVALWLVYGILIGSLPVIIANTVTLALSVAIMALKIRYARRDRARGP
jgi:MtN3 and saliva related transmembrane protein